jgi:uncharacterized membrane protein
MQNKSSKVIPDTRSKNPGNWKGIIYFNRKDSRVIVPKLNPFLGWTLNFGNPYTYFSVIAIVLIVLLSKYL